MYVVYCQNKPKSELIVSEYIDTFFEVRRLVLLERPSSWRNGRFSTSDFAGSEAATGTQTADHRSAHQACPTDHEIPAAAQG